MLRLVMAIVAVAFYSLRHDTCHYKLADTLVFVPWFHNTPISLHWHGSFELLVAYLDNSTVEYHIYSARMAF